MNAAALGTLAPKKNIDRVAKISNPVIAAALGQESLSFKSTLVDFTESMNEN